MASYIFTERQAIWRLIPSEIIATLREREKIKPDKVLPIGLYIGHIILFRQIKTC